MATRVRAASAATNQRLRLTYEYGMIDCRNPDKRLFQYHDCIAVTTELRQPGDRLGEFEEFFAKAFRIAELQQGGGERFEHVFQIVVAANEPAGFLEIKNSAVTSWRDPGLLAP